MKYPFLTDIINKIYPFEDGMGIISLLKKYLIIDYFEDLLIKFHNYITLNSIDISALTSNFLIKVNTKIVAIENKEEKELVEIFIKDIGQEYINIIVERTNKSKKVVLIEIEKSLKTTCSINSYSFENLKKVFPISDFIKMADNNIRIIEYYYNWNAGLNKKNTFINELKSRGFINSTVNIKKIFAKPKEEFLIQINDGYIDSMFILFDILLENKIISSVGTGKFLPMKTRFVDLDNNLLINKEPKQFKFTITKNKAKYNSIKMSIDLIFKNVGLVKLTKG